MGCEMRYSPPCRSMVQPPMSRMPVWEKMKIG